jgi:hypothetical protein
VTCTLTVWSQAGPVSTSPATRGDEKRRSAAISYATRTAAPGSGGSTRVHSTMPWGCGSPEATLCGNLTEAPAAA